MLTLCLAGGTAGLADGIARLSAWLEAAGAAPRLMSRAELLVEEVALNALRHGQAVEVLLAAMLDDTGLILVFEDAGKAFDPVTAPLPERGSTLATATVGGRGLLLLRRLAADLRYERTPEGLNRLRVVLAAS